MGTQLPPPNVRDAGGFLTVLVATGPCTTPPRLTVVVEGTPTVSGNRYAGGSYSSLEDKDDSPPLVDLPGELEAPTATASPTGVFAAAAPANLDEVLTAVTDMCGDIALICEGAANVRHDIVLTRHGVASSMSELLETIQAIKARNSQALVALRQGITDIAAVHTKAIDNIQVKVRSSFDRMKYLEKMFASVPECVTNHLDATLPAILTHVVGQAITPTLTTVLAESLPPTMTLVLEGSLADFQERFDSAIVADSTLQVGELLEAATDSCISDHVAVMTTIEGIGARLRVLDDIIALSDTSPARPSPVDVRPPTPVPPPVPPHVPPRLVGSPHMPVPQTWGHGFQPSAPAPTPTPHQSRNPLTQNSKLENNASA